MEQEMRQGINKRRWRDGQQERNWDLRGVGGIRAFTFRRGRQVRMLLHGDDFMMVCGREAAEMMKVKLRERRR